MIPTYAEATVDARFLPGQEDVLLSKLDGLIGEEVEREILVRAVAVERRSTVRLSTRCVRRSAPQMPQPSLSHTS